ncbi:leucine-rich repeat flightless-interacting protein 2 [Lepisosteus oculatus]|uniref:leucine-rich repeat flightless-interacting protein 2 n=1 Tax=Lepisosteus oculatus TaxID=7918 RepID=UPI0035F522D3
MPAGTERTGTPRKRGLSKGMSEDESLRHIMKETEGSARRLPQADSKLGSGRKLERAETQSEEDLIMGHPEMPDLQESYDEALQDIRALELQREVLLFEVDCLRETLGEVEELLAEARREGTDAMMELERERQARTQLEIKLDILAQEVQRLREEKLAVPAEPAGPLVKPGEEQAGLEEKEEEVAAAAKAQNVSQPVSEPDGASGGAFSPAETGPSEDEAETTDAGGVSASFLSRGEEVPAAEPGVPTSPQRGAQQETLPPQSEEEAQAVECVPPLSAAGEDSPLMKFQKLVHRTLAQLPGLQVATEVQDAAKAQIRSRSSLEPPLQTEGPPEEPPADSLHSSRESLTRKDSTESKNSDSCTVS